MICCFKLSDSPITQHPISRRRHQKSLKELASNKLAPDLESKAIGQPDSQHKSIRHPSTHDPQIQTPKPVQTQPTMIPMPNSKTEKRWNECANRTRSHKLDQHKHRPEHLFSATLWTIISSFFAEEKNLKSSKDWIHHNCTTLGRPKGHR